MDSHQHFDVDELLLRAKAPLARRDDEVPCGICRSTIKALRRSRPLLEALASEEVPTADIAARVRGISRAREIADEYIRAAEQGDFAHVSLARLGLEYRDDPNLGEGVLLALQLAAKLAPRDPDAADILASAGAGLSLPGGSYVPKEFLIAEANLLGSQVALTRGRHAEAVALASEGVTLLERAGGEPFEVARARYFEASALGFSNREEEAVEMFRSILPVFEEWLQTSWVGRTHGALGLALLQLGETESALREMEAATKHLDQDADANNLAAISQNMGLTLATLGRFDDAARAFSEALAASVRHGFASSALHARTNLIAIDLERGKYPDVVRRVDRLLEQHPDDTEQLWAHHARLMRAEALLALGRTSEAREALYDVGAEGQKVLSRLDLGDIDAMETRGWLRRTRLVALGWLDEENLAS